MRRTSWSTAARVSGAAAGRIAPDPRAGQQQDRDQGEQEVRQEIPADGLGPDVHLRREELLVEPGPVGEDRQLRGELVVRDVVAVGVAGRLPEGALDRGARGVDLLDVPRPDLLGELGVGDRLGGLLEERGDDEESRVDDDHGHQEAHPVEPRALRGGRPAAVGQALGPPGLGPAPLVGRVGAGPLAFLRRRSVHDFPLDGSGESAWTGVPEARPASGREVVTRAAAKRPAVKFPRVSPGHTDKAIPAQAGLTSI